MFRTGIVSAQDLTNCRVRVRFPDHDQMTSWWLPIVVSKSQNDKAYHLPDIGEQVVCLMDEHDEDGAVLGCVYSSVDTTPVQSADKWHVTMKDGASFEYDRNLHVLNLSFSDGAQIKYDAGAHALTISVPGGDISLKTNDYSTSVNGIIATFNSHTHSGVTAGSGNTGVTNEVIP